MDILNQAEIALRDAGYETWMWTGASPIVVCFEGPSVLGFVHVFDTAGALLEGWQPAQQAVLVRHAAALRAAGTKAWNVYSVFLCGQAAPIEQRAAERIEEDFSLTRKIVRVGLQTNQDVERALLALTAVKAQPVLKQADFEARLRARLKDIPAEAVTALLSQTPPEDVVRILGERA